VITSPQAAAWGDIQRTLKQRHPGLTILLSPCLVQGEEAPVSIVTALTRVEKDHRAEVIILSRGGGASDDLSCFNDERVVLGIAHCSIPIITGIGHERDRTLADLVADVAVSTPTAAAQKAVPELSAMILQERQALFWKRQRLLQATKRDFQRTHQHFQYLKEKLIALHPQKFLQRGYAIVRTEEFRIAHETTHFSIGQELLIEHSPAQSKILAGDS
jgi:exodeoxyribonuclease VII large subunit